MSDYEAHPVLVAFIESGRWKEAAVFLGGALRGLAEIERPTREQRKIAIANAKALDKIVYPEEAEEE